MASQGSGGGRLTQLVEESQALPHLRLTGLDAWGLWALRSRV